MFRIPESDPLVLELICSRTSGSRTFLFLELSGSRTSWVQDQKFKN